MSHLISVITMKGHTVSPCICSSFHLNCPPCLHLSILHGIPSIHNVTMPSPFIKFYMSTSIAMHLSIIVSYPFTYLLHFPLLLSSLCPCLVITCIPIHPLSPFHHVLHICLFIYSFGQFKPHSFNLEC